MTSYSEIFENNRQWIENKRAEQPDFFEQLAIDQKPDYLYIGCSDSRVTAEEMMGVSPGEAFVHRNVANMVIGTDLNVMSVINYAVRHLGVKHVIVCGHYGCGGVRAAAGQQSLGIINNWLRNIEDVYRFHREELLAISEANARIDRLVELNVEEQVLNLAKTAIIQRSWQYHRRPTLHGWVYGLDTGILKPLTQVDSVEILDPVYRYDNL